MPELPRLNPAIRALESGKPAFVTFSPAEIGAAQSIGAAAYDGVVFEMEHNPYDIRQLRDCMQYMLDRALGARPSGLPQLRGGHVGSGRGRPADAAGRARVAQALKDDLRSAEIERRLDELREHDAAPSSGRACSRTWPGCRAKWSRAADRVLDGLGDADPVANDPAPPDPKARRRPARRQDRARVLAGRRA